MITNDNIGAVLAKIRKHNKQYTVPAVTLVARNFGRQARLRSSRTTGSPNNNSPYHVLISTLISLRTKDEVTSKAAERLFKAAYTPHDILKLSEKRIAELIYPAGFYRTKAKTIKEVTKKILEKYSGKVPDVVEELTTMKGVGRKTANLVVTLGYNKLGICVDTHVHRISNRFGYVKTKMPDETEQALRRKLPTRYWIEYNDLLVTFGQNHCVPISPKCSVCPVAKECTRVGVSTQR